MKKAIVILLIVFSFTVVLSAAAADTVSLQFTYAPVDFPNVYLLPNGYYEAIYYTPNTSEYWLDQGRNDVTNCVVEVFDTSGQSVWSFPVFRVDILQDDPDAFFYQNVVLPDQIVFEYYWDHSYERYVSKEWGFDGEKRSTSFDSIKQPEESFRYIRSQYPYTLEMWPFGEAYNAPAKLTYVVDQTAVELPFSYGIHTTCVSTDERFYMLYEAHDAAEGENGAVYLLTYSPDTRELTQTQTNLDTCAGHIAVINDTLVFLQSLNAQEYMLYTAAINNPKQETISFTAAGEIAVDQDEVIDTLIPSGNHLLCLKSRVIDRNTESERLVTELCGLSLEGDLSPIQKWDGEAIFLGNASSTLLFLCEDGAAGYQIIRMTGEDISAYEP